MPTVLIVVGLLLVVVFGGACYGAYRIYTAMKKVERELIEEVSKTKKDFQSMVSELLPDDNKPNGRRIIEAEEVN